jgi:hypothetical protein
MKGKFKVQSDGALHWFEKFCKYLNYIKQTCIITFISKDLVCRKSTLITYVMKNDADEKKGRKFKYIYLFTFYSGYDGLYIFDEEEGDH